MTTSISNLPVRPVQVDFANPQQVENAKPETRNLQTVSEWAGEKGMLSSVMDMQSVRRDEAQAAAVAQRNGGNNVNSQNAMSTVTLSATGAGDANKSERMASAMPSVVATQTNITQPNNKAADTKSTVDTSGNTTNNAVGQTRSQPTVAGGTDITGADAVKPTFVNVIGPMSQIYLSNKLTVALVESENLHNMSAAKASNRFIDATARSAQKGVQAAEERRDGAIVGGITSAVAQGGMSATSVNALRKENASLDNNVRVAKLQEMGISQQKTAIGSAGDNMIMKGQRMDVKVKDTMSDSQAKEQLSASDKHTTHSQIQNNTQKVRVVTELGTQLAHTTRNITEGAYNVNAAQIQGEADLARADGTQNSELANTHKEVAKKAAETRAAINQTTESVLNANNSAASTIAERMR